MVLDINRIQATLDQSCRCRPSLSSIQATSPPIRYRVDRVAVRLAGISGVGWVYGIAPGGDTRWMGGLSNTFDPGNVGNAFNRGSARRR
jgi:hypothetical protein